MIRSAWVGKSRRLWWVVLVASLAVGGVGGGTLWWVQHSQRPKSPPFVVTAEQPRLYWLKMQKGQEMLVSDPLQVATDNPTAALRQAMNLILSTPPQDMATAIPTGTRLLGLELQDGAVYVNLSREFTTGGGSYAVIYRVAQVIYTASSLNPQAPIYLQIEGQPAPPIAGEGLVIDYPTTRSQFAQQVGLPLI